jgi:hypothetical protein
MLRQEFLLLLSASIPTSHTDPNSHMHHTSSNTTTALDTSMVRDAIEASVFFATSLGRLGGDFTSQLVSIFEPIVFQIITEQYWNVGIQQFHHTLEICRDAGIAGPLTTIAINSITMSTTTLSFDEEEEDKNNHPNQTYDDFRSSSSSSNVPPLGEPQPPPKKILSLPPLARFVNAVLSGLNELRRCLLPGIFIALRQYMKTNVIDVMKQELNLNERMVLTPGLPGDAVTLRWIAVQMKEIFRTIVEPYLLGSLEAAIGYNDGAIRYHTQLYDNIQRLRQQQQQQQKEQQKKSAADASIAPETEDIDDQPEFDHPTDSDKDTVVILAASNTDEKNDVAVHDTNVVDHDNNNNTDNDKEEDNDDPSNNNSNNSNT